MLITALFPMVCGFILTMVRFRSDKVRLVVTEAVTLITSLLVVRLLVSGAGETIRVEYGNYLNVSFAIDGAGRVLMALIAFLWPLAILYTNEYMEHEERPDSFCGFYIATYGVMVLLCCAHSMFTMYVAYELLTIVTLPLVWHKKDRDSIHAARDYVCYSIGAAALGFISLIFVSNFHGGEFEFGTKAMSAAPLAACQVAYILGFFGFGVKSTVFPLSFWLPRACAAPTPVTALLHAVAVVNAGIFALIRITFYVFDPSVLSGTAAQYVVMSAAILTILYGAVMAVRVRHVKRKLAFSTISNLGYMLFGISLMTEGGMTGAFLHMTMHSLMKIMLFFCIGAVMCKTERAYMPEMHGLAQVMPKVFAVFVLGAIALMGIPPFCGFISKFTLAKAAVAQGSGLSYVGAGALLVSSVLTAIYSLSVLIPAYTMPLKNTDQLPEKCDPGLRMMIPLLILAAAVILAGVHPEPLFRLINGAAEIMKEAI